MKYQVSLLTLLTALLLASCSTDDYLRVVPADCQALLSIDLTGLADEKAAAGRLETLMKSATGIDDLSECGIALDARILLFETGDGLFGLCAKVDDESDLQSFLDGPLATKGFCQKTVSRKDCHFTMVKDSWLLGFSGESLLLMGPLVSASKAQLIQLMSRLLNGKEKENVTDNRLYQHLDSLQAPLKSVTQARALPEQVAALLTLGAPKDADPSQVCLSLTAQTEDGIVEVETETFSLNARLNASLHEAQKEFRPVTTKYLSCVTPETPLAFFLNMEGERLLALMRDNPALQSLLAGVNTAIDMDNILRSIDGDLSLIVPSRSDQKTEAVVTAQLKSSDFLKDIGYWKQSCPAGTRIEEVGSQQYLFTDGSMSLYFGVSDHQFYASSTPENCQLGLRADATSPNEAINRLEGQRMGLLVNLRPLLSHPLYDSMLQSITQLLFGDAHLIVGHAKES